MDETNEKIQVYQEEDIKDAKPGDIISKIKEELKNDPLYRIMLKSNKDKQMFTSEIRENLADWRIYTTKDIEGIMGINMATSNNWINTLRDYIEPIKSGKYNKITPIGLIRIRMVQILRDDNICSLSDIKNLILPEIIDTNSENSENIGTKVQRLEDELENVKKQNELLITMFKKVIDFENLDNAENGKITLNKELVIPLLEDDTKNKEIINKIEKLENENTDIRKEIIDKDKLEEILKKRDEEIQEKWASASQNQLEELKKVYSQKKPLWKRLLGK